MISELEMFPTSGNEEERTMQEKVIKGHRIGMPVLLLEIVGYVAAIAGVILGAVYEIVPLIVATYLPNSVSTSASCGLSTFIPGSRIHASAINTTQATMRGTIS